MARTDKQLSFEEKYQKKMDTYAEIYKERTDFASRFKLKPEKTKGYYDIGDPSASEEIVVGDGDDAPAGVITGSGYVEKTWNFLAGKGMTTACVAGIMGNLQQESGIDPTKKQYGGGPGRGLCQWEAKHSRGGGRWDSLVAWAKQKGWDEWDIVTQLEYMWKELTEGYVLHLLNKNWGGIEGLKKASDYKWAVDAFEKSFERAGKPNFPQRYKFAKGFLDKYGKGAGGTATVIPVSSGDSDSNGPSANPSTQSLEVQSEYISTYSAETEDYSTPMTTPVGSIKNGRYVLTNAPRSRYAISMLDDARMNDWKGWAPLDGKSFVHLAGPQENMYAPQARDVFQILKMRLEWDKVKVVHGFQHMLKERVCSMHNVGMAMDVYVENIYEALYVADTAWTIGIRAISIGGSELDKTHPGFVHIDCGPKEAWPLNGHDVYKGPGTFVIKG